MKGSYINASELIKYAEAVGAFNVVAFIREMKQPSVTDLMLQIVRGSTEEEILAMYLRLSEALFRSMRDPDNFLGNTMVMDQRRAGGVSIEVSIKLEEGADNHE